VLFRSYRVATALDTVRAIFAVDGAELVDPPVVQPAGPYVDLSGEDVRGRLFLVSGPTGEALCLRPDLTLPVCRLHLERHPTGATPATYRYEGKAFRAAPEGDTRSSEFVQVGLERFAPTDPKAAEINAVALGAEAARAAGATLTDVVLGEAGLFDAVVDALDVGPGARARIHRAFASGKAMAQAGRAPRHTPLAAALEGLDLPQATRALDDIYALAGVTPVGGRRPEDIAARLLERAGGDDVSDETLATLQALADVDDTPAAALDRAGKLARQLGADIDARLDACAARLTDLSAADVPMECARFSVSFARRFEYYDGLVFELCDAALGTARTLAAGGRYDPLVARLGAPTPVPAVGVALRPGRVAASAEVNR